MQIIVYIMLLNLFIHSLWLANRSPKWTKHFMFDHTVWSIHAYMTGDFIKSAKLTEEKPVSLSSSSSSWCTSFLPQIRLWWSNQSEQEHIIHSEIQSPTALSEHFLKRNGLHFFYVRFHFKAECVQWLWSKYVITEYFIMREYFNILGMITVQITANRLRGGDAFVFSVKQLTAK